LIKIPIYFLFVFFLCFNAEAQYYNLNFQKFKVNDGLPSNEIACLFTDSKGSIWVGTNFGLSKFNGEVFKNYNYDPKDKSTIGGAHILKIAEDKKGNIWLAIENFGLSRIDMVTSRVENFQIPFKNLVEERYINTVHIGDDGSIWVGTETNLFLFDQVKKLFIKVYVKSPKEILDIVEIHTDARGTIWAATYEGEILFKGKLDLNFSRLDIKNVFGIINQLYDVGNGQFLIASENGLFELQVNDKVSKSVVRRCIFFNEKSSVTKVLKDPAGNFWIATRDEGLQVYFPDKQFMQKLNISWLSPLDPGISPWKSIVLDKEGGIWLGGENGLFGFNNSYNQFSTYDAITKFNHQFSFGNVIAIEGAGNNLISVCAKGLSVYNKISNDFIYLDKSPSVDKESPEYYGIIKLDSISWWVFSSKGILSLKNANSRFKLDFAEEFSNNPILYRNQIYFIDADKKGVYWIATPNHGLISYERATGKMKLYNEVGLKKYKQDLFHADYVSVSKEGDVLVGYHTGFAFKKKNSDVFYPFQELIGIKIDWSRLAIYDQCESNGYWWFATEGNGLMRLDLEKGKVLNYTIKDGLASNSVVSVMEGDEGKMIVATTRGLSILDIKSEQFINYLDQDGLVSEHFIRQSRFKSSKGEYFLSTTEGMVSFFLDRLKHSQINPKISLSSLILNNKEFDDSSLASIAKSNFLKIKYNESLAMIFSANTFLDDVDYILRYKLNKNEEWKNSQSSKQFSIIKMNPGFYTIVFQLIDKRGSGMSEKYNFRLEVTPPYWKTNWFILLMIVLLSSLIWLIVRMFFNTKLNEQQAMFEKKSLVEKERTRIAMELHDDIGGNLTALSLMASLLKDKQVESGGQVLIDKISEASDQMVDDMNEIVWALNVSNDSLQSMIGYIRQNASIMLSNAGIKFEVNEPLSYDEVFVDSKMRRNIFLISKEIFNNIIKHASTQKVEMNIKVGKSLDIIISDHGVGKSDQPEKTKGGVGYGNMIKRAVEIGATVDFENKKGYTVKFSLPFDKISQLD
jgi:signal transduction histidine kinase/ligand-binding sensor domain-containing protein